MTKKRPQGRPRALTEDEVYWVREQWRGNPGNERTGLTQKEMADHLEVHPMTIYNVIHERGPYGVPVIPLLP